MAKLVEARLSVCKAQFAGRAEVIGNLITEDFERTLHARTSRNSGLRRTTEVRVIEIHKAVDAGANLATLAQLLPLFDRLDRAHRLEHGADGLTVADDDAVHAAHLARFAGNVDAVGRAHERHSRLSTGAHNLEHCGATGIGQAAVSEKRSTPDGSELGPTPSDVNRRLHRDMVRAASKRDLLFRSLSIMLGVALGLIVIGSDARIRTQVFIVFFVGYGVMRLGRGVIGDWAVER